MNTQKAFNEHSLLFFSLQKHRLYYFPFFNFFPVINSVLNNVPQLSSCSFATWGPFMGLACSPPAFLYSLESRPPWFLSGPTISSIPLPSPLTCLSLDICYPCKLAFRHRSSPWIHLHLPRSCGDDLFSNLGSRWGEMGPPLSQKVWLQVLDNIFLYYKSCKTLG